jgi:hypothetical protein
MVETRSRCWPFGVARARFNVTPCVRRLSTFITHAIFSFTTKTNMLQQNIRVSEYMEISRVHVVEPIIPYSVPVNVTMSIEFKQCSITMHAPTLQYPYESYEVLVPLGLVL